MATGDFWDLSNAARPTGIKDPNSRIRIPFNWTDWLTKENAFYNSHEILTSNGMAVVSSEHSSGIINAVVSGGVLDATEHVTCRITAFSGGVTLIEDRTVYLKIKER